MRDNTTYVSNLNDGDKVRVTWLNGVQMCSLIPKGEKDTAPEVPKGKQPKVMEQFKSTGTAIRMSYKALRNEVIAGNKVYSKTGQSIPCTQRAEKTPNKEVNVSVHVQGTVKHFKIV